MRALLLMLNAPRLLYEDGGSQNSTDNYTQPECDKIRHRTKPLKAN